MRPFKRYQKVNLCRFDPKIDNIIILWSYDDVLNLNTYQTRIVFLCLHPRTIGYLKGIILINGPSQRIHLRMSEATTIIAEFR